MATSAIIALAAAFTIAVCTIGPSAAQGKTAAAAMDAIARQPDAAGNIRTSLLLSLALIEALTIYGLLVAFMLISMI